MVEYKIHKFITKDESEALESLRDLLEDGWEPISLSTVVYNYPVLEWIFLLVR